jgi:hypothetical protein
MFECRLKPGIIEAPYYGRPIYPGENWILLEDKYLGIVQKDDRIEIKGQKKQVPVDNEQKEEVINNNQVVDNDLNDFINGTWTQVRKRINESNNIEFLRDKLLPELEKNTKTKLIEVANERIKVLKEGE